MREINLLQTTIMMYIKEWADHEKTPIAQKKIIDHMVSLGTKSFTARGAIYALIQKGYIRQAYTSKSNTTHYVMIRNI